MKKHTQIYIRSLGYDLTDFMPSELSGKRGQDVHHIIGRGKCGEDRIENLMLLTREEHLKYGDKKKYMLKLLTEHRFFLEVNGVHFDNEWFLEKINYYEGIH